MINKQESGAYRNVDQVCSLNIFAKYQNVKVKIKSRH